MKLFLITIVAVFAAAEASYAPAQAPPMPVHHSSYSAGPSVPCPKNVVVSCAPSVQAVPCKNAGGHSGYAPSVGSPHGAYSEYAPQYAAPSSSAVATDEYVTSSSQYAPQYVPAPQYYGSYGPYPYISYY